MLIGIDASRATVTQRTGTEGYSLHIIRGLIKQGSKHRIRLYFRDTPPQELFPTGERVEVCVINRVRMWTHLGLGPTARRDPPDVLFVPAHVVPWPGTGRVPAVFTAHDLGYLHYPDKHPLPQRLYLAWSTRHSANVARRVIAVSKATAHDLVALNGIPREKIRVVYSGVDDLLAPVADPGRIDALRARLGIPGPYILHVGSIQPRKNLVRLVEAFRLVMEDIPDLTLVLAGRLGWDYQPLLSRIGQPGLAGRVILAGFVPDEDLPILYSGAAVYAFPSLYEGFGFPALEAMACGTPVICSNTSSLPELVGDAALTFPPTDVTALADALRRVLTDASLRSRLIARGFERGSHFTWEAAAQATLDVLLEAAGIG
jgi:glycosyltransferase involved in cell wall biosynthesis